MQRAPLKYCAKSYGSILRSAKASAFALYFLYYIGMDISHNIVWVLPAGVASTLVLTLNLSPALRNLMPIALSNAFYLGEIISLTTPGGLPPDNPGKSLTGFVEAVTMTHVVLRDFRRKQTWITHDNFMRYNPSNWTRRPCRLIHISFTVSSTVNDAEKVAQLAAFSRKWMDANEKVDLSSYKKSVVVDVKNGGSSRRSSIRCQVSIHIHCVKHTSLPSSKQRNALVSQWYPMNCLRRFPKMGLVEPLTRWSLWTCWHTKTRIPRYLPRRL